MTGVEQQFKYTTPSICKNATCGNRKAWKLVREQSVFVDWQRVKVQENADEVRSRGTAAVTYSSSSVATPTKPYITPYTPVTQITVKQKR